MYESLLSTVFQSITYEIATISAYKMNVIRICHHSIICLFFSWGTWHLSADYIWSSKRTWILPALQHNRKKPTGSSTLTNIITTRFFRFSEKTLHKAPIPHISALGGQACLRFSSFHPHSFWVLGFQKPQSSRWQWWAGHDARWQSEPRSSTLSKSQPQGTGNARNTSGWGFCRRSEWCLYAVLRGLPLFHTEWGLLHAIFLGLVLVALEIHYFSATAWM